MSTKRKHVTLSLREKKEIINKLDEGETTAKLARTYGVGRSTIYGIKVNRDKILEFLWTAEGDLKERKTVKPGYYREMENALFSWYMQERARHAPLSGDILREKAKQIYDKISKKDDFRASDGWLINFKKRFGICFSTATGEKLSSDASVDDFHRKLELKIQKEHLSKTQDVSREDNSLSTVPETESIFAKYITSHMKHLPKSVCNMLMQEIKYLVDSKRNSNSFSVGPVETNCDFEEVFVKSEIDIEEFVNQD